ncbi:MAG: tetratricopeptide repeat protein [candidate division Zixibacteria bacterium]|jgi:putative nucleotidyltransferase with HDIG domain|nr:tetratricopeptide repeat protein [candidate division Zixibacteria bacterium]
MGFTTLQRTPSTSSPDTLTRSAAGPDWSETIDNLMRLAKQAVASFEFDKAIDYLQSVEDIWDSKGIPEYSLDLRIDLHREKGKAFASQGKIEQAIEEYQKVLLFCRDSSHLQVKSETFTQIGQLLGKQGDYDRALGYLQRAIGAYRRLDDTTGTCKALRNLGVIYVELGEFEEAEVTLEEAITLARTLDNRMLCADLVNNLGAVQNMRGNWRRALELYRESLTTYSEFNEIRKAAYTRNNVAITLLERGLNDEAFDHFQEAYAIAGQIKDASLALIVDINLADLYLKKGFAADADRHCTKAHEQLRETGVVNGHLVEVRKIAGKIAAARGDHETAMRCFDEALAMCHEIGSRFLEADVMLERGLLHRAAGRPYDALNDLEASYHLYASLKATGRREQTEQAISSIELLYLEIFNAMAVEVDQKDPYTKGHSDRVASLALLLGQELGLRTSQLKTVVAGALLHDIGKLTIDDAVLKKSGRLTDEEFRQIKTHAQAGLDLLADREFPWDIKPIILYHHEKIDGSGYPLGLRGEDIPLGARIVGIADVFDALTSDRVYRVAYLPDQALEMMEKESGTSFDPMLLKRFADMIRQGAADPVINSRTSEKEMYSIWSRCLDSQPEPGAEARRSDGVSC